MNLRLVTFAATTLVFIVNTASADEIRPLSELVVPLERPEGAPGQADICLSSRWPRPMNGNDFHNTFEAMETFHANRVDWCYTGANKAFVQQIQARGQFVFGTINAELSDAPGTTTRKRGRDRTRNGGLVPNPELKHVMARGDVANEAFREVVLAHCEAMLDAGVSGIQVDDPGMTYHGALYADAGYGEASVAAFLEYLKRESSAAERRLWGLPEHLQDFDYRAYADAQGKNLPVPLNDHFLAFHRASLDEFYVWLRTELDDYAGRRVPLCCNNGSNQRQEDFPYVRHFDFWVGETGLQYGDPTPRGIFAKAANAQKLGMVQVFSPPNDGLDRIPTRAGYIDLTRKLIATSYASGSPTLVPWDVWRRGPDTPRFFGTAGEFGDLYDLVHENRDLFSGYELAYAAGPGIQPWFVDGLNEVPIEVPDGVFVAVRALPGKADAPIVIHLVNWRPENTALEIRLGPALGRSVGAERLHITGKEARDMDFTPTEAGWREGTLDAMNPYGVLVVP
jgi:hypothetical protein